MTGGGCWETEYNGSFRRFALPHDREAYSILRAMIAESYSLPLSSMVRIAYTDVDGDECAICHTEELWEAFRYMQQIGKTFLYLSLTTDSAEGKGVVALSGARTLNLSLTTDLAGAAGQPSGPDRGTALQSPQRCLLRPK
jgi:hypothetical protein